MRGVGSPAGRLRMAPKLAAILCATVILVAEGCGSNVAEDRLAEAAGSQAPLVTPTVSDSETTDSTVAPDPSSSGAVEENGSREPVSVGSSETVVRQPPTTRGEPRTPKTSAGHQDSAVSGVDDREVVSSPSSAPGQPPEAPAHPRPVAPAPPAPRQGDKSEILIGSFGTSSGPIGAVFAPVQTATRAWVAEVNSQGGLDGHPVRVIYADDGGDGARALAIARRMVEDDGVLFFMNLYQVTTIEAVVPYLEEKRVPVVQGGGASPAEDHSEMIFKPTQGGDAGWVLASIESLKAQSDKRKIAVLYCRETNACPNGLRRVKEQESKLGIQIVYDAQVSIAQPDYTAEVLQARNSGADVLFTIMDAASNIRAVRSAQRQGWAPLFLSTPATNDYVTTRAPDLEGSLSVTQGTPPYMEGPWLAEYRETVAKQVPDGPLGGTGASAWVAAKLVEKLAPLWGETPTRKDVIESLYSLEGETLGGLLPPITFPRSGDRAAVNLCGVPLVFDGEIMRAPLGNKLLCGSL